MILSGVVVELADDKGLADHQHLSLEQCWNQAAKFERRSPTANWKISRICEKAFGLRAKKEIIEAQQPQLFAAVLSGFSGNVHIVLMNQISPGNP